MTQWPEKHTIYIRDAALWQAFRVACITHKTSASQMITQFIEEQLTRWQAEAAHEAAREE